ncbi:Uncharacterised protein [Salmonella enterica]|nr:Uncharacterised protein [Salmonella enterica]
MVGTLSTILQLVLIIQLKVLLKQLRSGELKTASRALNRADFYMQRHPSGWRFYCYPGKSLLVSAKDPLEILCRSS